MVVEAQFMPSLALERARNLRIPDCNQQHLLADVTVAARKKSQTFLFLLLDCHRCIR